MKQIKQYPKESQELYLKTLNLIPEENTTYRDLKPLIDNEVNYYPHRNGAFTLVDHLVQFGLVIKTTVKIGRFHYNHYYRKA